jgi:pimeloyl-ACP methyl ester carboxylesterase
MRVNEQFCAVGDVELCYETFGDRGDPALLLVMGLGTQMIGWHEDFCGTLAGSGFFVVRYDNRDVGRSTRFDGVPPPHPLELVRRRPRRLAYTLADMAEDGLGLLEQLGVGAAHVAGASMGGMIAQTMAARHPDRVRSLASIMSTTGSRWVGQPAMRVYPFFLARLPADREAYVERIAKLFRIVGSPGFERDEESLREMAALAYDRGISPAGTARQLAAISGSRNRTADLQRIQAPTVVIHGTRDRMINQSGGKASARAIPGARLMLVDGMGHDLPRGAWPQIVGAIVDNASRAGSLGVRPDAAEPAPLKP